MTEREIGVDLDRLINPDSPIEIGANAVVFG
jgi:hypothetical protein